MRRAVVHVLLAVAVIAGASAGWARPVQVFNYDEMYAKADLVVIATPVSVKELDEKTELPGVRWGNDPIRVFGLETTFQVSVVLRCGVEPAILGKDRIVLHHYRLENPKAAEAPNAVQLLTVKPEDRSQYLMFLKRAADGRYEPFNGQTDPVFSIEKLRITRMRD